MLGKFFESLYHKVYVNIIIERTKSMIYIEECSKTAVVKSDSQEFETTTFNSKIHKYIDSFTCESPYYYISILDYSKEQGATPTCSKKDMSNFCNLDSSKHICYDKKWAYYTSKADLETLQRNYSQVGVDFIFSPFIILANFFKDKITTHFALFILIEDNYISLSVFDNAELLYAHHINIESLIDSEDFALEEHSEDLELLEDSIDLDDVNALDDMDSLDDFGDIENLDSVEEIDEFAEEEEEEEEEELKEEKDGDVDISEGLNEDYHRFSLIQNSVEEYYKDPKYRSEFLEQIYIADAIGVSDDLKKYLEEEMFLSVFIRRIDLSVEICEMAKVEVK